MLRAARVVMLGLLLLAAGTTGRSRAQPPAGRWALVLARAGVGDPRVAAAMEAVDRRHFLPEPLKPFELSDRPLPVGEGQAAAAPSLIARMIAELELEPGCKVLVIGAAAGYPAALVSRLCNHVYGLEQVGALVEPTRKTLSLLDLGNVELRGGGGARRWSTKAPFDGILLTSPATSVPQALVDQLWPGSSIVVPLLGARDPTLLVVEKRMGGEVTQREVTVGPAVRPSF